MMLTVQEAAHAVMAAACDHGMDLAPLGQATGRILREDIRADRDYPPINRATMDGIAIAASSWTAGQRSWTIEATIPAGMPGGSLHDAGTGCVQIMTGAEVPHGCTCVIPFEEVAIEGDTATARSEANVDDGQNIHRHGSDRKKGDRLLAAGTKLDAPRIAILAAVGHTQVHVALPPRVAVVSTGNEIVPVNRRDPAPTEVRASNLTGLRAALHACGCDRVEEERLDDDYAHTVESLGRLASQHDILIITGGVSKGKYDHVPGALEAIGAEKIFHRVAQKPGKPFWFGRAGTCTVFGLPGNPVSTLTVFRRYVRPFIETCAGCPAETEIHLPAHRALEPNPELTLLLPVRLVAADTGAGVAPVEYHGSGDFAALAASDGFIEVPPGKKTYPAGTPFVFRAW